MTFKRLEWMAREEEVPSAAAVPPYHDNLQHLRALHDPAKKEVRKWGMRGCAARTPFWMLEGYI